MNPLQPSVGREQLKRLPSIVTDRRALAVRYAELLADISALGLPIEPAWARSNWQSYAVRLPRAVNQQGLMQTLLDDRISTRRGIMCSHREPAYRDQPCARALVHSEHAQDRSVLLPLFCGLTFADQRQVVAALREACSARREMLPLQAT